MTKQYQWPSDPVFQTFQRKVADAVTLALAEGWIVRSSASLTLALRSTLRVRCPLGCLNLKGPKFPMPFTMAHLIPGVRGLAFAAFACGFDNPSTVEKISRRFVQVDMLPYTQLGVAYRNRFNEGKTK